LLFAESTSAIASRLNSSGTASLNFADGYFTDAFPALCEGSFALLDNNGTDGEAAPGGRPDFCSVLVK
jgi:hypothetical protein